MDKVIAYDTTSSSFRVYFPKCDSLLAAVRALPVRRFHKDWDDPYWIAGGDDATCIALARIAFQFDFVVDSVAAQKMTAAHLAGPTLNITAIKACNLITRFEVRTTYNPCVVAMLKGCLGATMDASKTWSLPSHGASIDTVISLVRDFDLTIANETLASIQRLLKKVAADGYVDRCVLIDELLAQREKSARAIKPTLPPLAVLNTAMIQGWIAGSAGRRETAKVQARANRAGLRATQRASERGFGEEAAMMTRAQISAVHNNLRTLAGVCDGAATQDSVGFNGPDAKVGRSLAMLPMLEPLQAALARSMLSKYTRQLGKTAIASMH